MGHWSISVHDYIDIIQWQGEGNKSLSFVYWSTQ